MPEDALWYEAAFVAGCTNALNAAADSLANREGVTLVEPVDEPSDQRLAAVYEQIREFYQCDAVPVPFRQLAHDPGYLSDFWQSLVRAFSNAKLQRSFKEALAFAVSLTTRSSFGTGLHLAQMRRLGVSEKGVMEILGVAQMFSSYTKIADVLQLRVKDGSIQVPLSDPTPAPGGVMQTQSNGEGDGSRQG